jgi:chromosome segregation ATPase
MKYALSSMKATNLDVDYSISNISSQFEVIPTEYQYNESEIKKYKSRNELLEFAVKNLNDKVLFYKQNFDSMTNNIENIKIENDRVNDLYTDSVLKLNKNKNQIINLQKQLDKELSKRSKYETEEQNIRAKVKKLTFELIERDKEIQIYQNRIILLQDTLKKNRNSNIQESTPSNVNIDENVINSLEKRVQTLQQELNEANNMLVIMENGYLEEIRKLEKFIDDSRETERINRIQQQSLVENAQKELSDLKSLLISRDSEISSLKDLLNKSDKSVYDQILPAKFSDNVDNTVLLNRAAIYDYLIAGDLREQRRLIEKQFSLLENIASGINSNKDVNNKSSRKSWKKKLGNTLNSIKSFVGYLVGLPASSNSTELEVINEINSNKILNDDIQSSVQTYVK